MTMSTFPVNWDDPADARYTWTLERMHAPEPMTLADALGVQVRLRSRRHRGGPRLRCALTRADATHKHLPVPRPCADELARGPAPGRCGPTGRGDRPLG